MTSESGPDKRGWLFGARTDLLLGCGLGSMAVMGLQAFVGGNTLSQWIPGALLVLVFAIPHYGATLLRVYEDPADRRKYRLFAGGATVLVAAAFVGSLYGALFGSLLLTLYLTWSPWHYSGQNYGIALMLAARRGVRISPTTKRLVHASFLASFALTLFAIHSDHPAGTYAPVSYGGTVYELLPLGIPQWLTGVAIAVVGVVYLLTTGLAISGLLRAGGFRAALPSLTLMATQALWFALPVPVRYWELAGDASVFRAVYTAYGFLWIAGYHALQYLWITTYYATETSAAAVAQPNAVRRRAVFLGKSALVGYAVWTLPALLFAPGVLGRLPHESGLALMVAAMVNLHHFLLDGAIWKLRDGRVARVLLRSPTSGQPDPAPLESGARGANPWIRRTVMVVGALCVVYGGFTFWGGDFGFSRALKRGDFTTARTAIQRLAWLGRDGPSRHTELGRRLAREGDLSAARSAFTRSLELQPTNRAFQSIGRLYEQQQEWRLAASAYDSALALGPEKASTLFRAGRAWLESGQPERSVPLLERASELAPEEKLISVQLARARREAEQSPARTGSHD